MKKPEKKEPIKFDLGLGGLLKGLGSLVDLAKKLSEENQTEFRKEGEFKSADEKGIKAVYGFSVKIGGEGNPSIERFGNVREDEARGPVVDDVREPMTDLFDEGTFFLVVAEMPGINEKDIQLEIKGDILTITGQTGDKKYYKEISISSLVDEKKIEKSYKNGIFEVKLWKITKPTQ